MDYNIIIDRVTALATERGVSPSKAYIESGAGKDFAGHIRKGQVPTVARIQKLADYFGVSLEYLLGHTETKSPPSPDRQAKADLLMQLLIDKNIISEDYTPDDLRRVADIIKANSEIIKQIIDKNKQ